MRSFVPMLLLLFGAAPEPASAPGHASASGPPAVPSDSAADLDLSSYRGKVVFLDFWASWCKPCRKSFPWLNEMHAEFAEDGLAIVGVNVDRDRGKADAFLEETPASFRIVYDPEGTLAERYALKGLPTSILIDRGGNERATHVGFRDEDGETLEKTIRLLLSRPAAGVAE